MKISTDHELDPRARHLLRALIARYVADGQPVGSRTLAKSSGLEVSAATIRNIMSDLEESGLVSAPHTSAGRVPTAKGYRVFVDSMLELEPLDAVAMGALREQLSSNEAVPDLLTNASALLSQMTRFVGVVSVPKREEIPVRHIDFVALDAKQLLLILVFTDGQVQNRIIRTERPYAAGELERVANYLNQRFAGMRMDDIRQRLLREMRDDSARLNKLLHSAVEMASHAFEAPQLNDMLVAGQTNLMGVQELGDVENLRELFDAFQRKRDLLYLLDRCARADGVRLFIGEESGFAALQGCSLVTAPYGVDGHALGVLGVIGPTRMAYERIIPVVQAAADMVTSALNDAKSAP